MTRRSILMCDRCGNEENEQQAKFFLVAVNVHHNIQNRRSMKYVLKKPDRLGSSEGSTNGGMQFDLCAKCMTEPLFEQVDVLD